MTTQQANHAPPPSEWGMRVGAAYMGDAGGRCVEFEAFLGPPVLTKRYLLGEQKVSTSVAPLWTFKRKLKGQ